MKLNKTCVLSIGTTAVVLALSSRVIWMAGQTETGGPVLRQQWRDAFLGWFTGRHDPIYMLEPIEQADFWLRETQRVVETQPKNAACVMGAAWVLDAPGNGFMVRYLKTLDLLPSIPGTHWIPDSDRVAQAAARFESKCARQCLSLAARATELEPGNAEWWRLRALLLTQSKTYRVAQDMRDPGWLNVLEQCAEHDPENALYDYLAAHRILNHGTTWDYSDEKPRLIIRDREAYALAVERVERGHRKKRCMVGDKGYRAVLEFLRKSSLPCTEWEPVVNSRDFYIRPYRVLRQIIALQAWQAEASVQAGDAKSSLAILRKNLAILDQVGRSEPAPSQDLILCCLRIATLGTMQSIAERQPAICSAAERDQIASEYQDADLCSKVLKEAYRRTQPTEPSGIGILLAMVTIEYTPRLVVLLGVFALVGWLVARWANRRVPLRTGLGWWRHVLVWLCAYGMTFAVLGMAPAEIIPRHVQAWGVVGLTGVAFVTVAAWLAWALVLARKFQFTVRALLGVMLAVSLLFGLLGLLGIDLRNLDQLHLDAHIPVMGWHGIDAGVLQNAVTVKYGPWPWALLQWTAHQGQYVSLVVIAAFLGIWLLQHSIRTEAEAEAPRVLSRLRHGCGRLAVVLSRSMLALAIVWLLVYLYLAPTICREIEQQYQQKMAYARNPQAHRARLAATIGQIRAEEPWSTWFRAVKTGNGSSGEPHSQRE